MACSLVRCAGRVYVSASRCIYENLAFEEHVFRTHDLDKHGDAMIVWSNRPAIVYGRHQNPWMEVNLPFAEQFGVDVARRHSGGGTVYHDEGNLNISVLTSHKAHCRPKNLRFLSEALNERFELRVEPNQRDDLELSGRRKVSGTAARISRGRAYHHLTLLVDVELPLLSAALKSPWKTRIRTNATASVRAPAVGFLRQDDPTASVQGARDAVIQAFVRQCQRHEVVPVDVSSEVAGSSEMQKTLSELRSWQWRFGKTPKFTFGEGETEEAVEAGIVKTGQRVGQRFVPF